MPRATITIKAARRREIPVDYPIIDTSNYPAVVTAVIQTNGDVFLADADGTDFRMMTNLGHFIKHYEAVA